jgi:N4-gp56 family major capsid protein
VEAKTMSYFYSNGFISQNAENAVIFEMDELEREQGDNITHGQIRELSGAGVANDGDMEGNEEVPSTYDDDVTLSMIRNAVVSAGQMSMQRPSDDRFRMWAKTLLARWKADTVDQEIFTLIGTSSTKAIYGGDATATSDIEAGDYMTLYMVARARAYARKASPKIVGPSFNGKRTGGVCVMSIDQSFDLTERDGSWSDSRMNALMRGRDNPIFTEAIGMHKNVVLHDHERLPVATTWGSGSNLNGATAFYMGVGTAVIAYGKRGIYNEKTFDYGNKVGFCTGVMYGVSKMVFNSADNALVELRTYRSNN